MKNVLNITIIFFAFQLTLCSCNSFLEEQPKSQEPADAYYKTENQVNSAVNNLYNTASCPGAFFNLRGYWDGSWAFTFDYMSGMVDNPVVQNASITHLTLLSQTPELVANYVGSMWSGFYSSIRDCNNIISRLENNSAFDPAFKSSAIATAKYFRALNYYCLVRLFGGVPLVLEPVTSLDNIYVSRESAEKIFMAITNDLEWALAKGMLANSPMGSNGNKISKGSVAVVLAEVYLTMAGYPLQKGKDYYLKALETAKMVVDDRSYALFDNSGGTTAFEKLRLSEFDKGSEHLYFIEYAPGIQPTLLPILSFPGSFPRKLPDSNIGTNYGALVAAWKPTDNLVNLYDKVNDIRMKNRQFYHSSFSYKTNSGSWNTINFDLSPFRWYDSLAIFGTANSGKYFSVYRTADAYLIAAEAANEAGMDPTPYITPILKRAYVQQPAVPGGQNERKNLILAERYRELAMEAHFWYDMLRTRLYPDADGQHKVTFSPLLGHDNGRGVKYREKDLLLPLPVSEMQRNPSLRPQNPGY